MPDITSPFRDRKSKPHLNVRDGAAERLDKDFVGGELAQVGEDGRALVPVVDGERGVGGARSDGPVLDAEAVDEAGGLEEVPGEAERGGGEDIWGLVQLHDLAGQRPLQQLVGVGVGGVGRVGQGGGEVGDLAGRAVALVGSGAHQERVVGVRLQVGERE